MRLFVDAFSVIQILPLYANAESILLSDGISTANPSSIKDILYSLRYKLNLSVIYTSVLLAGMINVIVPSEDTFPPTMAL